MHGVTEADHKNLQLLLNNAIPLNVRHVGEWLLDERLSCCGFFFQVMKLYKCGAEALSSDYLDAERREEESLWQHVRPWALIWITVSSRVRLRTPIITLFCGWSEATWSERRRATSEPLTQPERGEIAHFFLLLFLFLFIFFRGCIGFGVVAAMLQQNDVPPPVLDSADK